MLELGSERGTACSQASGNWFSYPALRTGVFLPGTEPSIDPPNSSLAPRNGLPSVGKAFALGVSSPFSYLPRLAGHSSPDASFGASGHLARHEWIWLLP